MKKSGLIHGLLLLLFASACLSLEFLRPRNTLGCFISDLAGRSEEQRTNILLACRALDGIQIEPKGVFSFNRVVGPRSLERGYRFAPAFLENEKRESLGGGICQVSSTLYAAVLDGGFEVLKRVPHNFLVSSVPPGRDATVWYGGADLVWRNDTSDPVRLEAEVEGDRCRVRILGRKKRRVSLSTRQVPASRPRTRVFQTSRLIDGHASFLLDVYRK
ncbi:MAG TPA: VanW family protein [Chroococcales cyanobacterium]|jgi:vancomycin resistance protein YoaR